MKNKEGVNKTFFLFGIILLLGFVCASFQLGEPQESLKTKYSPNSNIEGSINISFTDEETTSSLEDSRGNSISLIELLEDNSEYNFECSPINCNSDYSATSEALTKTVTLGLDENKLFGFKFNSNIEQINSISFQITSNAGASCSNQLKIDLFNDGDIDTGNIKSGTEICTTGEDYGCFDFDKASEKISIDSVFFCQKITLPEAPAFRLGANITKISGSRTLLMELYSIETGDLVSGTQCQLGDPEGGEGEVNCLINYLITEESDYYVCLHTSTGTGDYKITGYEDSNGCGFHGQPVPSSTPVAYQIFATPINFDSVGTLTISNTLPSGENFANLVEDYIIDTYGKLDCSENSCVVPFNIISSVDSQLITLKTLVIDYDVYLVGGKEEKNFYELTETPATINSEMQSLILDSGDFTVPDDYGDYTFRLNLNDEEILSKEVSVEALPEIKSLSPTKTASSFPTEFKVSVESGIDISIYQWDFGDSTIKNTTTNTTIYTYNDIGKYNITITIFDSENNSISKMFNITVDSPEEIIGTLLTEGLANLENINTQINGFDSFSQIKIKEVLDLDKIEASLKELQQEYLTAGNDTEILGGILTDLLLIEVPQMVTQSASSTPITFYPASENINLDILQSIAGGEYGDKTLYKDAIYSWNQENLDTTISFKEFSAIYEQSEEYILRVFTVSISENKALEETPYFIIKDMNDLSFKDDYSEEEEEGYYFFELINSGDIVFGTTEEIDFVELPLFISPPIDSLSVTNQGLLGDLKNNKNYKWILFVLVLFLVALLGIILYVVLQVWYKRKYENYLFKNKNNLYNIVNYISVSKKKGMEDKEIISNLKKAKWSNEQIRYVMRKYYGKRTGMYELPIGKDAKESKRNSGRSFPPQ